ncbi:preprotein translocase subunit SecY [Phyllobacterium sp. SB3]|uniref:preprotein translocase subunit SecY n=1 Tax=Phyllobacterium sp. SB3 TaxID=3156073 RepID=UPI0032AEA08F
MPQSTGMLNPPWARIALAFIAILLGSRIPVPGIDLHVLSKQISYSPNQAMARFSIFALGAFPLFTILAYMEIAKLIVPSLAKWQASFAGSSRMSLIVKILVLTLTAIQGYGMIRALTSMAILDGSASVLVAGIASFIGASAVMIWLADIVRLPGMGNGVWLLLTIPMLGALPHEVVTLVELMRSGAISVLESLVVCVSVTVAIAMTVLACMLLSRSYSPRKSDLQISSAVLLWPPFLANIIGSYLVAVFFVLAPELFSNAPWFMDAAALVLSTLLIPLFVLGYYRLFALDRIEAVRRGDIKSILLAVAGVQAVVCLGMGVLNRVLPLSGIPDGGTLIACVVVMLALRNTLARGRVLPETVAM